MRELLTHAHWTPGTGGQITGLSGWYFRHWIRPGWQQTASDRQGIKWLDGGGGKKLGEYLHLSTFLPSCLPVELLREPCPTFSPFSFLLLWWIIFSPWGNIFLLWGIFSNSSTLRGNFFTLRDNYLALRNYLISSERKLFLLWRISFSLLRNYFFLHQGILQPKHPTGEGSIRQNKGNTYCFHQCNQ